MTEINIPKKHIEEVTELIQDGFIQRVFGYVSVDDFVISAIEGQLEADKDIARWNEKK